MTCEDSRSEFLCNASSQDEVDSRCLPAGRRPTEGGGGTIGEDAKTYTEAEFALILAKAAQLAQSSDTAGDLREGISLQEMKAIAAEVGVDPVLIERAARLVPTVSRRSLLERLFGGPFSSRLEFHFPGEFTHESAEHLLAVARSVVGSHGEGEATASGMSWTGGPAVVSAHSEESGTRVRIVVDNRGRLLRPLILAPMGVAWVLVTVVEYGPHGPGEPFSPLLLAFLIGGIASISAMVWRSLRKTARTTRDTVDRLVEALSRAFDRVGPS